MAASNTDKFKRARRRFSTTVGPAGITANGTTLPLTDTTGLDADTAVVVVVDPNTPSEEVIVGVLGSGQITNCVRGKEGTPAVSHAGGAPVVMYFTETHWDDLIVGILQDHNQDGTHKVFTESNLVPTAAIQDHAVTAAKIEAQQAWQTPTLQGAWTNYGAPYGNAGYMKDSLGFVRLKGLVKGGATGTTIFTLPVGCRPAEQLIYAGYGDGAVVRLDIYTNGNVYYSAGAATSTYTSLQNVIFKAEG